MDKTQILNTVQIDQKINRMVYQVYENNFGEKELLIVGIDGNGYVLAKEIHNRLKKVCEIKLTLGKITLNKDEPWKTKPVTDFEEKDHVNKNILVIDDVLNSGKALMYATKLFLNKPVKKLNTLVLVDRSHTRFPIKADFVGLSLSTTLQEHIEADFSKKGSEAVFLI
ncbi:MAG: phosphoribosyltransferase family protein [Bacteroidota bacterium]|nr:phosphoribosyltransferase family protein [Bacteroidota bacterium]